MKHKMSNNVKRKFIKGKWYKDNDGWFHKFLRFDNDKSKKAILLVPKADYFGEQISTKILFKIKEALTYYGYDEMFEQIKSYIVGEERDSKLKELGL